MIKDLLWACVVCGREESLRPGEHDREVCRECGTTYERGQGANIIVTRQGSAPIEKPAGKWARELPSVSLEGSADCTVRFADRDLPIRAYGQYMGRYEQFGEPVAGRLSVDAERVRFQATRSFDWSLLDLTAIQLSSSTLQLKARRQPLVTIRFTTSSSKLWEERLQGAVQAAYHRAGKGDVVEFQPRIVTR